MENVTNFGQINLTKNVRETTVVIERQVKRTYGVENQRGRT